MAYNYDVKLEIANDKVRDVFDFNDIEHFALKILLKKQ